MSVRLSKSFTLLAVLAVLALLAAACGGNDEGGGGGTTTTAAEGDQPVPDDFNQAQFEGEPSDGGAVAFGVESNIATLDPAGALAQPSDITTALAIYDQLIDYDEEGNLTESLATDWQVSDDLKTWTITVRDDVQFHDGTPFNAQAVKAQFDRFMDPATNCDCAPQVEQIVSVEAPDDTTVVFTLAEANAFWANTLAGILGLIASPTATAKWGADYPRHPVGTGPFMLEDYDSLVLKKNPNYWQTDDEGRQLPYLDQITVEPIPDGGVRLQTLDTGGIDMMQTADTGTIVEALQGGRGHVVQKVTGTSSTIVLFNNEKPPFNDVRMRLAVAHALNRTEINNIYYKGARRESYGPFPPDSPFYADVPRPTFDLQEAKDLVAEAKADGVPTTFTGLCIPTEEGRAIMGIVQQQLEAAGLTMETEFQDQGAFVDRIFKQTGDYEAACFRGPQIANADGLYNSLYTGGSGNVIFYSNEEVDAALDAIRATADPDEHNAQLAIVQEQIAQDVPTLPILFDLFGNVHNPKVSGLPVPEPWALGAIELGTLYIQA